jgi:hypothetical protein
MSKIAEFGKETQGILGAKRKDFNDYSKNCRILLKCARNFRGYIRQ